MTDWNEVARKFPVNDHLIWLNACGTSPAAAPVVDAIESFLREYAGYGIHAPTFPFGQVKRDIQGTLARLCGCRPHEIALVQNTSQALNLISLGLDLRAGERILLLEKEYPSNVYPWQRWARAGVELSFVPLEATPERFLERFAAAAVPGTRVAAMSAVHWCTGMRLPVAEMARLCAERDIMLVLDLAQAAGHVPVDIGAWNACAAFSAWKWLLGPLGLGVMIVPDGWLPRLDPVMKGTESVVSDQQYLPYKDQLKPTAERYMLSTAAFLDWVWFRASLQLLEGLGFEAVRARITALADHLRGALQAQGFTVLDAGPQGKSGIVIATAPGLDAAGAAAELQKQGIVVRERDGRLRMAPHVFLTEEQLDVAAAAARRLLP